MVLRICLAICFIMMLITIADGKKVLISQTAMGKSHVYYSNALVDKLADRGHIVDKLVLNWNPEARIKISKKARKVIHVDHENTPYLNATHLINPFKVGPVNAFDIFTQCRVLFCEELMSNTELINQLRAEAYDIILLSAFDGCGISLAHILGIPSTALYVATSSADYVAEGFGIPAPPSYLSNVFVPIAPGRQLTFAERVKSYYRWLQRESDWYRALRNVEHPIVNKYYPGTPTYTELFKKLSFVFLNMPELLDIGRPISSKIKFIGGIQMEDELKKPVKELPEEYEKILSSRPKGTVIFSLGSQIMMGVVPVEIKQALLKSFAKFPEYSFIWKHDQPESVGLNNSTNVFFKKWLPQKELLADRRIRCFITHMGLNSYTELAYAGVPTIMLPLFADQEFNAGVAERKGLGITIHRTKVTEDTVTDALNKVLNDPKYDETAKMYSRMLRNQPNKPSETFVKYVEYAMQYPMIHDVLNLPSTELDFWVFNSYDVIGFFAVCGLTLLVVSAAIIWKLIAVIVPYVRRDKRKTE
uniref:glucuronosyltransferase n=1 Tax=Bursaphelenchus xylophilus TaxID=6326 RepID=A0A1I7SD10_BURXY